VAALVSTVPRLIQTDLENLPFLLGAGSRDRYESDRFKDGPRRDNDRYESGGGRDRFRERYDDRDRRDDKGGKGTLALHWNNPGPSLHALTVWSERLFGYGRPPNGVY